jgi:hypothetical protein
MKNVAGAIRPPSGDEDIAPVTILDGQGQVVCVVAPAEFRRTHPSVTAPRYPAIFRPRRADGPTS